MRRASRSHRPRLRPAPSPLGSLWGGDIRRRRFPADAVPQHTRTDGRRPQLAGLAPGWPPNSQTLWRSSAPLAMRVSATASTPRPPRSTAARCGCCRRKVRPRPPSHPRACFSNPRNPRPGLALPAASGPARPPTLPAPSDSGILPETSSALSFHLLVNCPVGPSLSYLGLVLSPKDRAKPSSPAAIHFSVSIC